MEGPPLGAALRLFSRQFAIAALDCPGRRRSRARLVADRTGSSMRIAVGRGAGSPANVDDAVVIGDLRASAPSGVGTATACANAAAAEAERAEEGEGKGERMRTSWNSTALAARAQVPLECSGGEVGDDGIEHQPAVERRPQPAVAAAARSKPCWRRKSSRAGLKAAPAHLAIALAARCLRAAAGPSAASRRPLLPASAPRR